MMFSRGGFHRAVAVRLISIQNVEDAEIQINAALDDGYQLEHSGGILMRSEGKNPGCSVVLLIKYEEVEEPGGPVGVIKDFQ